MFTRLLVPALLALGLLSLVSIPLTAHAQTAQVSQKPVLTTLHRFDGKYGANPVSLLTLGTDGNFYGVTEVGGIDNNGIVFKITPSGQFTTLWRFNGANGAGPSAALVQGMDGLFYGTTLYGGSNNAGTIFRITPQGRLTVMHSFDVYRDGQAPLGALLPAPDGSFYGTTFLGGAGGVGTVFHMTASGSVTDLHTFVYPGGAANPRAGVVFGPDGALYGTAANGGAKGHGAVFRLSTDGTYSVLHNFTSLDGIPFAALTLGPSGAFYGTAVPDTGGTLYQITPAGNFTTLHAFSNDGHGVKPYPTLTLGTDGNFYGVTTGGGTASNGTVFVMTPSGQVTTLYKFHTGFDGSLPFGGVAFGLDGALYGTTQIGGVRGDGTLYKLTLPQ